MVNWIAVASIATACVAIIALIPIIQGWIRRGKYNQNLKTRITYELIDFLLSWKDYRETGKLPYNHFFTLSEEGLLHNLEEFFPKADSLSPADQEKIAVYILTLRRRRGLTDRMTIGMKEPEGIEELLVATSTLLKLLSPSSKSPKKRKDHESGNDTDR